MRWRETVPARFSCLLAAALAIGVLGGCSVRRMAVNALGNALAAGGSSYASDDDPELVKGALPFALKTIEGLLDTPQRHRALLLAAASGFTQYSYAFVQSEADYVEADDFAAAKAMRARAVRLYLRARGYGLRGLEEAAPGCGAELTREPQRCLARLGRADIGLLYWTAAPWAAAISLAKQNAELTADLALTEALMRRGLELDEGWSEGAIHDFFIAYEGGRPPAAGGSVERARRHLERALVLAHGRRAAPLVSFAETVALGAQDRAEFETLLNKALAIDPDAAPEQRLANLVAQKRARWLLARAPELFLE
ncbi:MAG: TRAP transporter TatT component family protein [Acidobacteriota bacterium]